MTKEELKQEAEDWIGNYTLMPCSCMFLKYDYTNLTEAYLAGAEPRERLITELKAQIEKMKNCKNCANYMISGKCPCLFRTGWCKNWELAK